MNEKDCSAANVNDVLVVDNDLCERDFDLNDELEQFDYVSLSHKEDDKATRFNNYMSFCAFSELGLSMDWIANHLNMGVNELNRVVDEFVPPFDEE